MIWTDGKEALVVKQHVADAFIQSNLYIYLILCTTEQLRVKGLALGFELQSVG